MIGSPGGSSRPDQSSTLVQRTARARVLPTLVRDQQGAQVDLKDVQVGPDDPKRFSVSLPPLEPGVYVVKFDVLSVGGHVVESEFPFTIRRT